MGSVMRKRWVAPEARGLGRRLLQELERHARDKGVDEPYAHHWFEKRLT